MEQSRGKTTFSTAARRNLRLAQDGCIQMRQWQKDTAEEIRQMRLYTFTKMEQAAEQAGRLGYMLTSTAKERDMLKSAIDECEERIGPLLRQDSATGSCDWSTLYN